MAVADAGNGRRKGEGGGGEEKWGLRRLLNPYRRNFEIRGNKNLILDLSIEKYLENNNKNELLE